MEEILVDGINKRLNLVRLLVYPEHSRLGTAMRRYIPNRKAVPQNFYYVFIVYAFLAIEDVLDARRPIFTLTRLVSGLVSSSSKIPYPSIFHSRAIHRREPRNSAAQVDPCRKSTGKDKASRVIVKN